VIKSRKLPVARPARSVEARALGVAVMSLAAFDLARAAEPAADPQVMQGVSVTEEVVEEGYKVERASSPKFTQPLLDTPQTITVLNKELLQDRAASTLSEALRNSPGITFTMGENGNTTTGDSVFMRGFDTSGSIFVDGVRDLGTISRDVFNTETIEIVKGPSGSDYGRTAPTGYLNLSSKRPTLEDFVGGSITGGNESRLRATLDMNEGLDIGNTGAALRFNAMYDKGDKLGRDVADSERWGIAPSFALGLGSETRAFFNYLHVDQSNTPDGGLPAIGYPGYSLAALGTTVASPVDTENFYGSPNDFDDVKVDMLTVQLEHDLTSSTTLRNVSRYGRTHQEFELTGVNALTIPNVANPATWTVARSRPGKDQVNEILTNQTSLVTSFATGSVTHDLSSGVELLYERQSNGAFIASGTTSPANLYSPNAAGTDVFAALVPSGAYTDGKTMTGAFYVFDTLHFGEQWLLTAGVRAERYKTEFTSVPATTATPQTATLLDDTDTLLSGKLGLVFKPVPFGSVYATVATSQLPPGGTNFTLSATATNLNSPNLDPQKALNLEIGTKWDLLENTLVLTAALYDTTNKNDQAVSDAVTGEITQYGEKQVRGAEFGASGMITPAWQVSAGVSFMDTEVTEGAITSTTQQGAQINFSPKFSFTSWTTYKFPFGLEIGGGAQYVTSQTTQVNNTLSAVTNLPQIPSYWVFDAMASYPVSEKLALQLNVNNLADEFYIASVNNGRSRYALGAPRSVLLSANFRF
jgi:catecholate siderophore receptor